MAKKIYYNANGWSNARGTNIGTPILDGGGDGGGGEPDTPLQEAPAELPPIEVVYDATESSFDLVSGKFAHYMDLVNQTADALTTVKGNLDTALGLCRDGNGSQEDCGDVGTLSAYVSDLESDLSDITTDEGVLSIFQDDIEVILDGQGYNTGDAVTDLQSLIADAADAAATATDAAADAATDANNAADAVVTAINDVISGSSTTVENALSAVETAYDNQVDALGLAEGELTAIVNQLSSMNATLTNPTTLTGDSASLVADLQLFVGQALSDLTVAMQDLAAEDATEMQEYYIDLLGEAYDNAAEAATAAKETADALLAEAIADAEALLADTIADDAAELATKVDELATATEQLDTANGELDALNLQLSNAISALVASQDLAAEDAPALTEVIAAWQTALENYNASVILQETTAESVVDLETQLENVNIELSAVQNELVEANASITEFNTLSGAMDTAITDLEEKLIPLGYDPVDPTDPTYHPDHPNDEDEDSPAIAVATFDGSGWSSFQGEGVSEFKKLLFRGAKAREAYLNMAGANGEIGDVDNDVPCLGCNENGSDTKTNGVLKLGAIAALIYFGSKMFKK